MAKYLHIGGLVAAGFDPSGRYLLTVSHSGRGIYDTSTWQRIARNSDPAYPMNGCAVGIGPIDGISVPVAEIDYSSGTLSFESPDGCTSLRYESGALEIVGSKDAA